MTQNDKYWLIGGSTIVVIGGGIYAYKKYKEAQKEKELQELQATTNSNDYTSGSQDVPNLATTPYTPEPTPTQPTTTDIYNYKGDDKVFFQKEQRVMANVKDGKTVVYKTIKDANGNYQQKINNGKLIISKQFNNGIEIGTVIDVNAYARNNKKRIYFIKVNGSNEVVVSLHGNELAPVGTLIIPKATEPKQMFNGLDVNKILKKGMFNSQEVFKLQELLGFKNGQKGYDGDFGGDTEKALYKAKGVKQIALKNWK